MKKLILLSLSLIFISGGLFGCSSISSLSKKEVSTLNQYDNGIKTDEDTNKENNKSEECSTTFFPVYGYDSEILNKEINFYIEMQESLSLEKKLTILADKLSRFKFKGLPIKFIEIKNENNKKKAVINLDEFSNNKGIIDIERLNGEPKNTWRFFYFQGSAGGKATKETLIETFLQREYKGQWIDCVTFLYDNKPINISDHVKELAETIYR